MWTVTDAGRTRLKREAAGPPHRSFTEAAARDASLRDLATANRDEVKRRLLTELKNLSSVQFEHFCKVLLQQLGFQQPKRKSRFEACLPGSATVSSASGEWLEARFGLHISIS